MSKFLFLYQGAWPEPTPEMTDPWTAWFNEIGDSIVDSGNPLGPGRVVTPDASTDLPVDLNAFSGYTIVSAGDIDEAEKLLANCPIITSVHIYEAKSM